MPVKVNGLDRLTSAFKRMVEKQIPESVEKFHRMVTLELHRRIVLKTPVDTGRARVSWVVSVEQPRDDAAPKQKNPIGSPEALSLRAAEQSLAGLKPYSVSFIANNLPYIQRLEQGYSQQAPSGMVALSVNEVATFLESGLG